MSEWVSSGRRDWLWDSIRWMMAELDRWPPGHAPVGSLARQPAASRRGGVGLVLQWHGMAWHGHGNLGPREGNLTAVPGQVTSGAPS